MRKKRDKRKKESERERVRERKNSIKWKKSVREREKERENRERHDRSRMISVPTRFKKCNRILKTYRERDNQGRRSDRDDRRTATRRGL